MQVQGGTFPKPLELIFHGFRKKMKQRVIQGRTNRKENEI